MDIEWYRGASAFVIGAEMQSCVHVAQSIKTDVPRSHPA